MKQVLVALLTALLVGSCSDPALPGTGSTVSEVSVQAGDVPPTLTKCSESGPVDTYLKAIQAKSPSAHDRTLQQWRALRDMGAREGFIQTFSDTLSSCAAELGGDHKARVVSSFVVRFKDDQDAGRAWQQGFFGLKPPAQDQQEPGVTEGLSTALGKSSWVYDQSGGVEPIFIAVWQNGDFDSFLVAANLSSADARKVASNMNSRIH